MRKWNASVAAAIALAALASAAPAHAADRSDSDAFKLVPIADARLRFETVEQGTLDADALTLRLRAGIEAKRGPFSILAEAEGTAALRDDYNAFPFVIADAQRRPQFATISDPESIELNRLQVQYKSDDATITVGRQRINLDDQRWVGSVGWRQNEQTFDAVRGESRMGPVAVDLTYAICQRTIFGTDAGARNAIDGDFILASAGTKLGLIQGKLFAYLVDYDESFAFSNSSQTYGAILAGTLPVGQKATLSLRGSYARQSDYGSNPFHYAADYWSLEAGTKMAGFALTGGWEKLGSDNGRSVQTPLATLHKFNGWADLFLTTPADGLEDAYVSVARSFGGVKSLPGFNAAVSFHQFDSAVGNVEYGTEWDASAGFKVGKIAFLLKYADYRAKSFGADTRKLWLQAEWAL